MNVRNLVHVVSVASPRATDPNTLARTTPCRRIKAVTRARIWSLAYTQKPSLGVSPRRNACFTLLDTLSASVEDLSVPFRRLHVSRVRAQALPHAFQEAHLFCHGKLVEGICVGHGRLWFGCRCVGCGKEVL